MLNKLRKEESTVKPSSKVLKYRHIKYAASDASRYINARRLGEEKSLKTPWKKYNGVSMGGLEWFTIHTIAGPSGSGKTAIINQLETQLPLLNPDEKLSVLSFNFEMLARNLVGRKLSNQLDMSVQELYSGLGDKSLSDEEFEKVKNASKEIAKMPIHYVDKAGSVEEIEHTIRQFSDEEFNKDRGIIVMLDHTILVNGKQGELERTILVSLMTMFNSMKKEFYHLKKKIVFVLLSQMNREIEDGERLNRPEQHFPRKRDIFGGDSCFQFSDLVMVSMNPEQLGLTSYGARNWPVKGRLYWHFLKVREGQPVVAAMENQLKFNRVLDYVPPAEKEMSLGFDTNTDSENPD